ncbi:MAG: GIY-YIG nuclease family protein [Puniceicoccaceae bacterium]
MAQPCRSEVRAKHALRSVAEHGPNKPCRSEVRAEHGPNKPCRSEVRAKHAATQPHTPTQIQAIKGLQPSIRLPRISPMPSGVSLRHHVYLLRSISYPDRTYVGYTTNFSQRLLDHNRGHSPYTAKFRPWRPQTIISFPDKQTALAFERYLKSHSGKAFSSKRFLPGASHGRTTGKSERIPSQFKVSSQPI